MTTVYIPRPIRTVEDAEALPEGTIMFLPAGPYVWTEREPGGEFLDHYGRPWHFEDTQDDEPFTALVPVEAEEEMNTRWDEGDPISGVTRKRRLFTSWEAIEE